MAVYDITQQMPVQGLFTCFKNLNYRFTIHKYFTIIRYDGYIVQISLQYTNIIILHNKTLYNF